MDNYHKQMNTYWSDKEAKAAVAVRHTKYMAEKYADEIEQAIEHTRCYNGPLQTTLGLGGITPVSIVNGLDSVSAAIKYHIPGTKTCILNFASYKNPGGRFIDGSSAQEESLCHASFLYNVLSKRPGYYGYNKENLNKSLYKDRALYTPDVVFEQLVYNNDSDVDLIAHKFDVLTCAAPNAKAFFNYNPPAAPENRIANDIALVNRMKFVIDIMEEYNVTTAILGAFGCGVFAQNPVQVAINWKELTARTHSIKTIVHPVLGEESFNYKKFKQVFE